MIHTLQAVAGYPFKEQHGLPHYDKADFSTYMVNENRKGVFITSNSHIKKLIIPNLGRCFGIALHFVPIGTPLKGDLDKIAAFHSRPTKDPNCRNERREILSSLVQKSLTARFKLKSAYFTGGQIDTRENRLLYRYSYEDLLESLHEKACEKTAIFHLPPAADTQCSKLIATQTEIIMVRSNIIGQLSYISQKF